MIKMRYMQAVFLLVLTAGLCSCMLQNNSIPQPGSADDQYIFKFHKATVSFQEDHSDKDLLGEHLRISIPWISTGTLPLYCVLEYWEDGEIKDTKSFQIYPSPPSERGSLVFELSSNYQNQSLHFKTDLYNHTIKLDADFESQTYARAAKLSLTPGSRDIAAGIFNSKEFTNQFSWQEPIESYAKICDHAVLIYLQTDHEV